jgi:hypothetical protein
MMSSLALGVVAATCYCWQGVQVRHVRLSLV